MGHFSDVDDALDLVYDDEATRRTVVEFMCAALIPLAGQ
jgi:hypothetical protein